MAKIIAICGKICCGKTYYANQIKENEKAVILSFGDDEEKQMWRISCHKCRDICPHNLGSENKILQDKNMHDLLLGAKK